MSAIVTVLANNTTQATLRTGDMPAPVAVFIILCMTGVIVLSVAQICGSCDWHPIKKMLEVRKARKEHRAREKFLGYLESKRK